MATKIVTKNSSTAGAAPTATDLVQGELAVNVADGRLYTEDNAAAIVELGVNPATEITANAGIALPDNQKATFGDGGDLELFYNGTHSVFKDGSAGNIYIQDDNNIVLGSIGGENYLVATKDAAVTLYYDADAKLATTSTGIDVTGIARVTGSNQHALTIKSDVGTGLYEVGRNQSTGLLEFKGTEATYNGYLFKGPSSDLMTINASGNVGIGTSSPAAKLHIDSAATNEAIRINTATGYNAGINYYVNNTIKWTAQVLGDGTDAYRFYNFASGEAMRIDSSGNVGIGESDPSGYWAQANQLVIEDGNCGLTLKSAVSGNGRLVFTDTKSTTSGLNDGGMISYGHTDDAMVVQTAGDERMRIDSSGNLLVGKTTSAFSAAGIELRATDVLSVTRSAGTGINVNRIGSSAGSTIIMHYNSNDVGSIDVTATATSYTTSSDQRLKENIADADDAGSKIDSIQVRKYDWKADGSHQDYGMVAQELQAVAPEAVSGDADSEDMMGVDYSKLVPMLIKEIQSLRNRVAQLETGE